MAQEFVRANELEKSKPSKKDLVIISNNTGSYNASVEDIRNIAQNILSEDDTNLKDKTVGAIEFKNEMKNTDKKIATKVSIFVDTEIPDIDDREKGTLYFKVTDEVAVSGGLTSIKVSPNMRLKLVEEGK